MSCQIIVTPACTEPYKYCNALDFLATITIESDVSWAEHLVREEYVTIEGWEYIKFIYETEFEIRLPIPIPNTLFVNVIKTKDGGLEQDIVQKINAGVTVHNFTVETLAQYEAIREDQAPTEPDDVTVVTLEPQTETPVCTPAPGCTFDITGAAATSPTTRGGSDGSIIVSYIGGTSPVFTLDGGTGQTSTLFSGLTAGEYYIFGDDGGGCTDSITVVVTDGTFVTQDFIVVESNTNVASENPIITSISTAVNAVNPQAAEASLIVLNTANIVDSMSIEFNIASPEYTATFYAKGFPNRPNFFLSNVLTDKQGNVLSANSGDNIAASIEDALSRDPVISNTYFISSSGVNVLLKAKEISTRFNLSSSNIIIRDDLGAVDETGVAVLQTVISDDAYEGSIIDGYSIYLETYYNPDAQFGEVLSLADFVKINELELPFSKDNVHRFDTSSICKSFVSTPPIDFNYLGFAIQTDMLKPFFFKYGEKFPLVLGEPTTYRRNKASTGFKWVISGALPLEEDNDMSIYTSGTRQFLTNSPIIKDLQRNQQEFLYLIVPKDYGNQLDLRGTIEYYDGTIQSNVVFFTINNLATNTGGVYVINVGFDALDLASFEAGVSGTKIKKVTLAVWENNGSALFSDFKTYRYAVKEITSKFGVAFENRPGGYDTFEFSGSIAETVTRESKTLTVPLDIQNKGRVPEGFKREASFDTFVTEQFTVNTGWIDLDHFNWLQELLSSNNIYSYTTEFQSYLTVTGYKYEKSNLDSLYNMEVTFKKTFRENS